MSCVVGISACWATRDVQHMAEHKCVRMDWVVVTDENGSRQLRMSWRADRDAFGSA